MENEKLSAAARAFKAEYMRQWRAKNPDKSRRYLREYWERKAAQAAEAEAVKKSELRFK